MKLIPIKILARTLQIPTTGKKDELIMRIRQRLNPSLAPPQPSPTPQVARPISIPVEDPCHESMKKQVSPQESFQRRQVIHQAVKGTLGGQTRVEAIAEQHLLYIFQLYDHPVLQLDSVTCPSFRVREGNLVWRLLQAEEEWRGLDTHTISISRPVLARSCTDNPLEMVNDLLIPEGMRMDSLVI